VGCNNSCTFCIVPSVRGPEISRRPGDILDEVRRLVDDGVVEFTLLGQNVDTYGRDLAIDGKRRPIFADLLRQVGAIEGVERVRFTSPHPNDFREDVARAMAETEAVCPQLHFPLQSGSDAVLRRMHRGYTAEKYRDRLSMAREMIPDLAVSTDIIVGFPGETDADFERTLELVHDEQFDSAFMFIFSPRPGTAAADYADEFVDDGVIKERFARLQAVQDEASLARNTALIGTVQEVISEGQSKKNFSVATTRARNGKLVHVHGHHPVGEKSLVKIEVAGHHHLGGVPV